jgi:hypothetical protein
MPVALRGRTNSDLDDNISGRLRSAGIRAADAYRSVKRLANRISSEMDEITMPGVPAKIKREDSLVTSIDEVITRSKRPLGSTRPPARAPTQPDRLPPRRALTVKPDD